MMRALVAAADRKCKEEWMELEWIALILRIGKKWWREAPREERQPQKNCDNHTIEEKLMKMNCYLLQPILYYVFYTGTNVPIGSKSSRIFSP